MAGYETPHQRPGVRPERTSIVDVEAEGIAEMAVPRLRHLSVVLGIIWLVIALAIIVIVAGVVKVDPAKAQPSEVSPEVQFLYVSFATVIGLASSVVMYVVTKMGWRPTRVLQVGTCFQIVGALSIAFVEELAPHIGLSLICIWILAFTLVPQRSTRAIVAAFGAALAGPVAIAINTAVGMRVHPTAAQFIATWPTFACAILAVFSNRVVYQLGKQVVDEKLLGAYQLVEKLGAGGMGEVWRAEHRSLIRPAAVKLLRRETTRRMLPEEIEALHLRFQDEVQATALLTSPHTIAVYDFGSTSDNSLYYVMELLEGMDVEKFVEDFGAMPAERVIYILRQICDSLTEAHENNLVHRDIKPANLYLAVIGMKLDFVKVLDFGLVKDLESDVRMTAAGMTPGTPAYCAPETVSENISDARSDIYALGCAAYWMLTGRLVFEEKTIAAMTAAHLRDTPIPPSDRIGKPIPPALDELVLECLSKNPLARPQTVSDIRVRLDAIVLDTPWTQDRAREWWKSTYPAMLKPTRSAHAATSLRRRQEPVKAQKR